MRSVKIALVLTALAFAAPGPVWAQTATANLSISATVNGNCTITTGAVAFGSYDPVGSHAATPLDNTGSVTVTCTKGAGTRIDLGLGANASGSTRRMQGPTDLLTYELYQDSARTTIWSSGAGSGLAIAVAPSITPRSFTVYGRVPAAQNVGAGTYTDTVLATVNF
jgi:spore coat protein U-like protein